MTTDCIDDVFAALDTLPAMLAADLDGCFERFVLAYQHSIYRFALRLTASAQDAEEIAQDAFVRAYRGLCSYAPERIAALALKPWLYQIALNVFRNRVRGKRLAQIPLEMDDHQMELYVMDRPDQRPDALAERAEQAQELRALVAALPPRYRVAVVLRHVEGFDYSELAALLDQPVGTIKSNVHRGVRLLRSALDARTAEVRV